MFIQQSVKTFLSGLMRRAVRFVLPVSCESCGIELDDDPVPFFCRSCWDHITPLGGPFCPCCHLPFVSLVSVLHSPTHLCGQCHERPPAFTEAWSLYPYVPPLQQAICLLKYKKRISLAKSLADLMIQALPSSLNVDQVMPVPLHPIRLREREFNQSFLFAHRISRHLHAPLSFTNLRRIVSTNPQTTLPRGARLKNVRNAFAVAAPEAITGKRILLVDDVYTTGTTVHECAKVLRKDGASDVYVVTLARTVDASLVPDTQIVSNTVDQLMSLRP